MSLAHSGPANVDKDKFRAQVRLTSDQQFSYAFIGAIYNALIDDYEDARAMLKPIEVRADESEAAAVRELLALLPPSITCAADSFSLPQIDANHAADTRIYRRWEAM